MLQRTEHWATRELDAFLSKRMKEPFAWGTNDCCLFPADAIKSFTGVDLADDFRGKYDDQISAMKLVKEVTGGSTVGDAAAYCANKHGLAELQYPRMAQRGDLVTLMNAGTEIAGIVGLRGAFILAVGENGLVQFSIEQVKRAWRV
jgi:hypothetical protein